MGSKAVSRHAQYNCFTAPKSGVEITKVLSFKRASGRAVFRIEVEDNVLATQVLEYDGFVTGRLCLEVGNDSI
jgi:hypothetical protein